MQNYIQQLPETAIQVKGALNWVDIDGNFYGIETRSIPNKRTGEMSPHKHYGEYFRYKPIVKKHNGYAYVTAKYIVNLEKNIFNCKQRRLHILVAETFLENPNGYPIVGHKNNIKTDNRVANLYWTTWEENTKKAVDDKLLVNDKGYDDSQSHPVIMFNTYTNEVIGKYGSICEANQATGINKNTISRQAKYKKPVRKPFYFRFQDDESVKPPIYVVGYDFDTDEEVGRYWNTFEASRKTGVRSKTIQQQCHNDVKPKWTKAGMYFLYSTHNI